jgi:methylphosphotriester-DNA--protein-cysteine methyltransferase/ribosomal protein S17
VGDKIEMRKNIEMSENMASVYFLRNYYREVLEKQGMTIEVYVGEVAEGMKIPAEHMPGIVIYNRKKFTIVVKMDWRFSHVAEKLVSQEISRIVGHAECIGRSGDEIISGEVMSSGAASDGLRECAQKLKNRLFESDELWGEDCRISDKCAEILSLIQDRRGHIRIEELENITKYSRRHIYRLVKEETGIGPKEYCRFVRIRTVLADMVKNPKLSITDYMEGRGFSDQAHFQREFKFYTGMTPRYFLKNCL